MATKVELIGDVNASKYDWFIVARVVRLWEVSAGDRFKTTSSIDMILVDEKGVEIHATVRRLFVKKFERVLKEGSVYSLRGFSVVENVGEYRLTKHEYKINIQGNTKVVLMAANRVACPPRVFVPFEEILGGTCDPSYLIDIIGILSAIGNEKSIDRVGTVTKMNTIELENSGHKLSCTLWGPFVDQLNKHVVTNDSPNLILAVFGVKIKEFQGKKSVQNSIHSTRLVFSPQFAEASELQRYLDSGKSSSKGVSRLSDSTLPSLTDDFLHLTPRKNINELGELEGQDACFIILGTIKCLIEANDWWYLACKCQRAVKPEHEAYYCSFCERRVSNVTPRYRIRVTVADSTGSATLIIFDRPATALFKIQCSEMIDKYDQSEIGDDCPVELTALIGKELLFKVDMKGQTSLSFEPTYRVKRLTDDSDLISSYKCMTADAAKESESAKTSDTPSNYMVHHMNSPLKPKNLIGDFQDSGVGKVLPLLPLVVEESPDGNTIEETASGYVDKATPSKRAAADAVESDATMCNPKLLKTIKIEKP